MAPEIIIKYIPGPVSMFKKRWEVMKDIKLKISTGEEITIKAGFKTDLSSVPRFLWPLFPPYGDFLPAAIVHDWMYINDFKRGELGAEKARKFADYQMLFLSRKYNPKNPIDNYIRFIAVRLFGGLIYTK